MDFHNWRQELWHSQSLSNFLKYKYLQIVSLLISLSKDQYFFIQQPYSINVFMDYSSAKSCEETSCLIHGEECFTKVVHCCLGRDSVSLSKLLQSCTSFFFFYNSTLISLERNARCLVRSVVFTKDLKLTTFHRKVALTFIFLLLLQRSSLKVTCKLHSYP